MGSVGLRQAGRNIRLSAKKTSSGSSLVSRAGVSPHFCQKDKMYVESESLIANPYLADIMDKKRIELKERCIQSSLHSFPNICIRKTFSHSLVNKWNHYWATPPLSLSLSLSVFLSSSHRKYYQWNGNLIWFWFVLITMWFFSHRKYCQWIGNLIFLFIITMWFLRLYTVYIMKFWTIVISEFYIYGGNKMLLLYQKPFKYTSVIEGRIFFLEE